MNTQDVKRKLTADFSAAVAGYSRLMGDDEAATVKTFEAYKQIMFTLIKQHRGPSGGFLRGQSACRVWQEI